MAVVGGFAINAGITGEFNYQGGARKTFYGSYPFEHPGATFDNRGISMTSNEVDDDAWRIGFLTLLPTNLATSCSAAISASCRFSFPAC